MPDEQVLAWLKAKARATDAEEQLSDMLDKAERLLRSLSSNRVQKPRTGA
jgi:hypothetical protein